MARYAEQLNVIELFCNGDDYSATRCLKEKSLKFAQNGLKVVQYVIDRSVLSRSKVAKSYNNSVSEIQPILVKKWGTQDSKKLPKW